MNSKPSPFNVEAGKFNKKLIVPTSKSYANRLLVLAALCPGEVILRDMPASTDVLTMTDCLRKVGVEIGGSGNDLIISNSFPECEKDIDTPLILETGDGGTTNRFLIPLLARGKRTYHVEPSSRMRIRPMDELVDSLTALGVRIDRERAWMEIKGSYGEDVPKVEVPSKKSTQFVTGLALALWDKDIQVIATEMESSKQYYEMTLDLIRRFREGERDFRVPADASSLSYPLAMGLTLGSVHVENCHGPDKFQADAAFISIIEEMGGDIQWEEGLKLTAPSSLKPIDRDCSAFPDLVPTLAYACACAEGTSILRNLEVLRHKESDRVDEIHKILDAFGVEYSHDKETEDLTIVGATHTQPAVEYDPPDDHRIIMVSYLFMRKHSGGKLHQAKHVAKSFPNFFEAMA